MRDTYACQHPLQPKTHLALELRWLAIIAPPAPPGAESRDNKCAADVRPASLRGGGGPLAKQCQGHHLRPHCLVCAKQHGCRMGHECIDLTGDPPGNSVVRGMSVRDLKAALASHHVDMTAMREKSELVAALEHALANDTAAAASGERRARDNGSANATPQKRPRPADDGAEAAGTLPSYFAHGSATYGTRRRPRDSPVVGRVCRRVCCIPFVC